MSRVVGFLLVAAMAVIAAAGAALLAMRPAAAPEAAAVAAPSAQTVSPPSSGSPAADPPPRSGRALSIADAVKELDLVQPPRPKRAEDFDVPMPKQGTFRLKEHLGKPVMVNFWATWCPPCLEEMPALERLYRRQRESGFVLVAISLDADPGRVNEFLSRHRLTFPVGLDPKTRVAEQYGVRALPSTFLIDRDGNLAALALGPRAWDNDASHALIEALSR